MKRSKFNLSHTKLFSSDMGELVPIGWTEVLPGDTFQHATSLLLRCSPLLAPVMHPVDVRVHHWYVPYRLLWTDFEDFITGGPDGMNASAFPTKLFGDGTGGSTTWSVGSLADYLGVPGPFGAGAGGYRAVSVLPFRAYQMIWNEYYRDQDLETEAGIVLSSGNDTGTTVVLKNCGWEKDYFTSARPWEQKGPSITIPLGTDAPVVYDGESGDVARFRVRATGAVYAPGANRALQAAQTTSELRSDEPVNLHYDPNGTLVADLSGASAITVTALREALALERFEENRARWGSRYDEYLRQAFGVRPLDARLQRPEYLGGGRQTIQFSEVLQTAEGTDPVGEMRGHGIVALRSNRYRRFFEEHGLVMSLFSVRPKTIYMQGLERKFNRRFKEDFFTPELAHIGQQEVLNKEIYMLSANPEAVFGFQDRYHEYRVPVSTVAGEFRNSTLNHWHLARDFSSEPALNATFVKCVPTERVFAVPSQDVLWCQARHSMVARRCISRMATSFIY